MFQINCHTLLIAVDKLKSSTPGFSRRLPCASLRRICRWGFDFQYFGAHIG
jgi:hypothetical protein